MKLNAYILALLFGITAFPLWAQTTTQTIRGTVIDKQSQQTIPGVAVVILESNPLQAALSDFDGRYKITDVLPGRYDLKITYSGYKEIVLSNIVVTAGKETVLDIAMEENITEVEEVVVSARKKNETNNELISLSGRSFSMEEVNRYAGGRSDPARLAANFAGVSSPDDSRNDIVIRGNSPIGVLWRIEGLNIPNPNHFSTVGTTGGPVSAINTNILRNSDFMTSAFPAEYGNANAGVFDLGFRNGNTEKREHTFQLGALTGLEFMTEGPIRKEKNSSYLIAYRYGFAGVAQAIGLPIGTAATPYYQDISFKINTGNTKMGRFTLFGLAAVSKIEFIHSDIDSNDLFADPTEDSYFSSNLGMLGLKHFIRAGEKSYFNTVIGMTYADSDYREDSLSMSDVAARTVENTTTRTNYSVNTSFNSKINARLFIKVGVLAEVLNTKLFYRTREFTPDWIMVWDNNDYTTLIQGYTHAKYSFTDKLTLNAGLHSQHLTLNNSNSIEPRVGLKYQLNDRHSFSTGYGMHSQMQPIDLYFYRTTDANGNVQLTNKDLDFTRSQHFVIGYEVIPFKDWRIKTEAYYQILNNVPITTDSSSFSMLNAGSSFTPIEEGLLVNKGTGRNYGLELTIEKYFSKGYYGLITGTLYEAKYTGSDDVERNTAFNGRFVYNVLVGKEIKVGKAKRNALTIDVKMTQAGGRHYTPVDLAASQLAQQQVLKGDDYAYSQRYADFFRLDVKLGFTMNSAKRNISQSIFFDIQNVTNNKNIFAERYNPLTNGINTAYQIGFFPNFAYKIQF
ncbi:MAG: TonB-dependent receptor [Bacteroidota bacterium]